MPKIKIKIQPEQNGDITIYSDNDDIEKDLRVMVLKNFAKYMHERNKAFGTDDLNEESMPGPIFLDENDIREDGSFTIKFNWQQDNAELGNTNFMQQIENYASSYVNLVNRGEVDIDQEENINGGLELQVEAIKSMPTQRLSSFLQSRASSIDDIQPRFTEKVDKEPRLKFSSKIGKGSAQDTSYLFRADNDMPASQIDDILATTSAQYSRKEGFVASTEQQGLNSTIRPSISQSQQVKQAVSGSVISSQELQSSDLTTTDNIFSKFEDKISAEAKYKDLEHINFTDPNNNRIDYITGSKGNIVEAVNDNYKFTKRNDDDGTSESVIRDMLMLIKEKEPDNKWVIDCKTEKAAKPFIEILGIENLSFRCSDKLKDILQQEYPGVKFADDKPALHNKTKLNR